MTEAKLIRDLDLIVFDAKQEQKVTGSYGMLQGIIESLLNIRNVLEAGSGDETLRRELASGLGYVILDNMDFSQSSLGLRMIRFADMFSKMT